jgi:hypothetical protein
MLGFFEDSIESRGADYGMVGRGAERVDKII